VLGDKFPSKVAAVPLPGWVRLRQAHLILEVGAGLFKPNQFVLENDVRTGAYRIEERDRSSKFEIVSLLLVLLEEITVSLVRPVFLTTALLPVTLANIQHY